MAQVKIFGFVLTVLILVAACQPKPAGNSDLPFPLTEPGPYFAARTDYTITDPSRGDRKIQVEIWYPAIEEVDTKGQVKKYKASPDMTGAPYPLILTEHRTGRWILNDHLVTHGLVMGIITVPDHSKYFDWDFQMIDWPRDFLFGLDQITSNPPKELTGVIDTDHVGVTGYSFGGDISLTLAGARIDPEIYLAHCKEPPAIASIYGGVEGYSMYTCGLAKKWGEFTVFAGEKMTTSTDGLWLPLTDDRIQAVMPMAPSGTWLYGEKGLAAVKKPLLMIASTEDEFTPYQQESVFLFNNLGTKEKGLITFIEQTHMSMVESSEPIQRMKHFATAFFGYHLQDKKEYKYYFSKKYVSQYKELYWGVYSDTVK